MMDRRRGSCSKNYIKEHHYDRSDAQWPRFMKDRRRGSGSKIRFCDKFTSMIKEVSVVYVKRRDRISDRAGRDGISNKSLLYYYTI